MAPTSPSATTLRRLGPLATCSGRPSRSSAGSVTKEPLLARVLTKPATATRTRSSDTPNPLPSSVAGAILPSPAERAPRRDRSQRGGRVVAPLQSVLGLDHLVHAIYKVGQVGHAPIFVGAKPHADSVGLLFSVPDDEHVWDLLELGVADLRV